MKLRIEDVALRKAQEAISKAIAAADGRAYLVGGCVRDAALGIPAKDLDIEVYGVKPDALIEILSQHFRIDLVGKAFGVIKIYGLPIDVSIPRRESKAGLGHKGFTILSDPEMAFKEAASRRDFTINAMVLDLLTGEIIDPFGGLRDLKEGVLRHTGEKFVEDPLRVLRGMQFVARFDLEVAPETIALSRTIESEGLARERIFDEWRKLILKGIRPSRGLSFLLDCGWIRYYPELESLVGCPQDPGWHPEGDVWIHTLHCMDAFAQERTGDDLEDLVVGLAVLCHDFGKPVKTEFKEGKTRSKGHEKAGEELTRSFLDRMTNQQDLIEAIVPLVSAHLRPKELFDAQAGDTAIRRLARHVGRIDRLVRVARADQLGRPQMPFDGFPAGQWLLERARALEVEDSAPRPIVLGRHLIKLGLKPGPHFGRILEACYQAQIEGQFFTLEEGIELAKRLIDQKKLK
ncbi:MAG: polynucleotide adenylyltransferase [candidate division Zixibacteria bacterium SM23_81]|nr:MAG: polynucleotide adenylyltransferase [candidate division Zixibacteria bacterium SM23_81]